jgi:ComEC/Rec2-related protein
VKNCLNKYILYKYRQTQRTFKRIKQKPFISSTLCYLLGIVFITEKSILIILITAGLFILVTGKQRLLLILSLLCSIITFLSYNNLYVNELNINKGKEINLEVIVIEPPTKSNYNQIATLKTDTLNGLIQGRFTKYPLLQEGDTIKVSGILKEPENFSNDFDYKSFLSSKKILYILEGDFEIISKNTTIVSSTREYISEKITKSLNLVEGSILKGIIYGDDSNLPDEFQTKLQISGLSHITSVSGFNFTIILISILSLNRLINRKYLLIVIVPIIISYLTLVGMNNLPAVRATIMILLLISGYLIGRPLSVSRMTLISLCVILTEYPPYIGNISLKLSYSALIGLLVVAPRLTNIFIKFKVNRRLKHLIETVSTTFSVILTTSLITIPTFGTFSFNGILSNLIVTSLIPLTMLTGTISTIISPAHTSDKSPLLEILDILVVSPAKLLTGLIRIVVEFTGYEIISSRQSLVILIIAVSFLLFLLLLNDFNRFKKKVN